MLRRRRRADGGGHHRIEGIALHDRRVGDGHRIADARRRRRRGDIGRRGAGGRGAISGLDGTAARYGDLHDRRHAGCRRGLRTALLRHLHAGAVGGGRVGAVERRRRHPPRRVGHARRAAPLALARGERLVRARLRGARRGDRLDQLRRGRVVDVLRGELAGAATRQMLARGRRRGEAVLGPQISRRNRAAGAVRLGHQGVDADRLARRRHDVDLQLGHAPLRQLDAARRNARRAIDPEGSRRRVVEDVRAVGRSHVATRQARRPRAGAHRIRRPVERQPGDRCGAARQHGARRALRGRAVEAGVVPVARREPDPRLAVAVLVVARRRLRRSRARQRPTRRADALDRASLGIEDGLRDRAVGDVARLDQVAAGVVRVLDDVARLVARLRRLEGERVDPHLRQRTGRCVDARRPYGEGRVGERLLRALLAPLRLRRPGDQRRRRRDRRDATLRVIRDLRHPARIGLAEAGHHAGRDRRVRDRRAQRRDAPAGIPADVLRLRQRTQPEPRREARDLRTRRRLHVLHLDDIAAPVDNSTEVARRDRDEPGIRRRRALGVAAVEESDLVARHRIGDPRQALIRPGLLHRRRVERPDARRMRRRRALGLAEDGHGAIAIRGAERAIRIRGQLRRRARRLELADQGPPLALPLLGIGDGTTGRVDERHRAIRIGRQGPPRRATGHDQVPARRQPRLLHVRRAVHQRPAHAARQRRQRRALPRVDQLARLVCDVDAAEGPRRLRTRALHVDRDLEGAVLHRRVRRGCGCPAVRRPLRQLALRHPHARHAVAADGDAAAPDHLRIRLGERHDAELDLARARGDIAPHQGRRGRRRHRVRAVDLHGRHHRYAAPRRGARRERLQADGVLPRDGRRERLRRERHEREHEHREDDESRQHASGGVMDAVGSVVDHRIGSPGPTDARGRWRSSHRSRIR